MKQFKKKKVPADRQKTKQESHPVGIEKSETAPAAAVFTSVECPHLRAADLEKRSPGRRASAVTANCTRSARAIPA
ncbi:hypothetical protein GH810_05950 [Acetobacterium paludosum]|uniref:Uncharacterized protein n=1 Tax=Acetobacterium paludosum TaxID=52693 RepID=A0A923HSF5_9FIRM|nr:hypothetical protein [Acetobacterium paludosum]MBC3887849.1 hypothetical protein [Acetobacterium paludosum]